jgi:hypothetical protein
VAQRQADEIPTVATRDDVVGVFGEIDPAKIVAIMSLRPTVADLEAASMWLSGDADIYSAGEPVKSVSSDIITILTEDEQEEP